MPSEQALADGGAVVGTPLAQGPADERRHTRIAPRTGWPGLELAELGGHKGLFFFLVWRDVKVRYAQTVLGGGWAVLQPMLTMLVFTVVFGRFARIPSDGVPYPVFSLAALVPWTYFATALSGASNSLVGNTNLITKVYFPRLVLPASAVMAALVDFAIAFAMLLVVVVWSGFVPASVSLLLIPVLLAITMATAIGIGCWLGALHVRYRDVKYVTAFVLQLWLYLSPVVYPSSIVPPRYRPLFELNPMVAVIDGFRSALIGATPVPWDEIARASVVAATLLIGGVLYFRRSERDFADVA